MPYLKSICIHSNVRRCLRYILNPDKTEELLYTSSLNCLCSADEAYLAMKMIYEHYSCKSYDEPLLKSGKNKVKAIHYIQSFSPDDNVTPEAAHRMAKAFARKFFGDDVQVVIATHNDKQHIHSHLLVNAYSVTGMKYNDNQKTLEQAREYSDRVCLAFGIQPIMQKDAHSKGMKYNEWDNKRKGTSWKQMIRDEIDSLIMSVKDIEELYAELEKRGYTVKRSDTPSIKAEGQQRFVRFKTLGEDYTEQALSSRILWKDDMGSTILHTNIPNPTPIQQTYISAINGLHIMITENKKIPRPIKPDLPYLPNNDRDVYVIATQLSIITRENIQSIGELETKIAHCKAEYESAVKEINALTTKNTKLKGIISQAEKYFVTLVATNHSVADDLMLNICKQTMLANGIHSINDLNRLKKAKAEQDNRLSALRQKFETAKKQFEVYSDIADTYHDICEGDNINKMLLAERQKQISEEKQKLSNKKPKI